MAAPPAVVRLPRQPFAVHEALGRAAAAAQAVPLARSEL